MMTFAKKAVTALGLGALASACCWLPMILLLLGLGGAGIGAFLAPARLPLMLLTCGVLAWTGWRLYRQPSISVEPDRDPCGKGACCMEGDAQLRLQRRLFWGVAIVTAIMLAFPWYAAPLLPANRPAGESDVAEGASQQLRFMVEGMTCTGCATILETRLRSLEGVVSATVSHDDAMAYVHFLGVPPGKMQTVACQTIEAAGFRCRGLAENTNAHAAHPRRKGDQ